MARAALVVRQSYFCESIRLLGIHLQSPRMAIRGSHRLPPVGFESQNHNL